MDSVVASTGEPSGGGTAPAHGRTAESVTGGAPVGRLRARPVPAAYDRPFWDGLREHRLVLPYCADCAAYRYPPAPRCPRCLTAMNWRECPDTGTLWSWATARRAFAPGHGVPYTVIQVELDAQPGLLIDSTLADEGSTPQRGGIGLRVGLPVTAVYIDDPRGFTVHAFAPAVAEAS